MTLPDRPGALARIAAACGEESVNIVGLQVFPDDVQVVDELVLRAPADWTPPRLRALVEAAGGRDVSIVPASEQALDDQPARYVRAARAVLADPNRFPDVLARLLDADPGPDAPDGSETAGEHVLDVTLGPVSVQVWRRVSFTAVERARAVAIAELVGDVLEREPEGSGAARALRALPGVDGAGEPQFVTDTDSVTAWADGSVVGVAMLRSASGPRGGASYADRSRQVVLRVAPAHRRRGIGTRLLTMIVREAAGSGVDEIVMTTAADNPSVMPLVLGSGLVGRIRMTGETLTVRIPVTDVAHRIGHSA